MTDMLQKSENVAKNVANKNSQDLIEQWKKGELTGEYWCEITESPYPERVYLPTCDNNIIVKVLAPVPTFDEWQAKLEENAQLKELLRIILSKTKICYSMVFQKDIISAELNEALLKKIDEALQ